MENNDIQVSVICNTYNHEKYIRDALEGFVRQRTTFKFEVLVHDDASTDRTADIVREYEKKYPDIIKPYYETENQYSKHDGTIGRIQRGRAKGKYIALCEGDDFWIDESKLQKQYEVLENNVEYSFCIHKTQGIEANSKKFNRLYPNIELKTAVISAEDYFDIVLSDYQFQTSSFFFRKADYDEMYCQKIDFLNLMPNGDIKLLLYMGAAGKVYYIDEIMSHYRLFADGSWNQRFANSTRQVRAKHWEKKAKAIEAFDIFTCGQYHSICCNSITKLRYIQLIEEENNKELLKKPYRSWLLQRNGYKYIVLLFIRGYCPKMYKLYRKMKRKCDTRNGRSDDKN